MTRKTVAKMIRTIDGLQWRLVDGTYTQKKARAIAATWRSYKYLARVVYTGKDRWPWSVYIRDRRAR